MQKPTWIVLIGFMGSGKTSVGKALAKKLAGTFIDLDAKIETAANMSIADIFAAQGEIGFRQQEHLALQKTLANEQSPQKPYILATGGGTPSQPQNQPLLQAAGPLIWLDADLATILKRTQKDTQRPLLQQENRQVAIAKLLQDRRPIYQQLATYTIDANQSVHQVVGDIVSKLQIAS